MISQTSLWVLWDTCPPPNNNDKYKLKSGARTSQSHRVGHGEQVIRLRSPDLASSRAGVEAHMAYWRIYLLINCDTLLS